MAAPTTEPLDPTIAAALIAVGGVALTALLHLCTTAALLRRERRRHEAQLQHDREIADQQFQNSVRLSFFENHNQRLYEALSEAVTMLDPDNLPDPDVRNAKIASCLGRLQVLLDFDGSHHGLLQLAIELGTRVTEYGELVVHGGDGAKAQLLRLHGEFLKEASATVRSFKRLA